MAFNLPEKDFYTLDEISKRWECSHKDIEHLIYEQGLLRIAVRLENAYFFPLLAHQDELRFKNELDRYSYLRNLTSDKQIYCNGIPLDILSNSSPEVLNFKDFIYINKNSIFCSKTTNNYFLSGIVRKLSTSSEEVSKELNDGLFAFSKSPELFDNTQLGISVEQSEETSINKYKTTIFRGFLAFNINKIKITQLELNRFENAFLNKTTPQKISDLNNTATTKTIKSLQKLVLGMAISKYNYKAESEDRQPATGKNKNSIHSDLELLQEHGLALDDSTIREALKAAKESVYKPKS